MTFSVNRLIAVQNLISAKVEAGEMPFDADDVAVMCWALGVATAEAERRERPATKPSKLPPNARRRSNQFPGDELQKACNKLYYGDENISEPPGKTSMFRGVVAAGAVLTVPGPGGDPVITCGGVWTIDPSEPEYTRALGHYLRNLADALDREAGS